jgi:hypothetical protein
LTAISNQAIEGSGNYVILPSDLKLTEDEYTEVRDLARQQSPSIPVDILEVLARKAPTYHPL